MLHDCSVKYAKGSLCKSMCVHIHLCLVEQSRVGEGHYWGSISTLLRQRGWMSVLAIGEWNRLQNSLIGSHRHVVLEVRSSIWSSEPEDKLLSPSSLPFLANSISPSKWIRHCRQSPDGFIEESRWEFSESEPTAAMLRNDDEKSIRKQLNQQTLQRSGHTKFLSPEKLCLWN